VSDLARLFKALSDPTRLAIFELIRAGGNAVYTQDEVRRNVSDIAEHFDLSLSTVSHHLKELRTAGLIRCEKRGKTVHCSHNPEALGLVERFLGGVEASSGGRTS
jgi:ArsR family transcriptional regulator